MAYFEILDKSTLSPGLSLLKYALEEIGAFLAFLRLLFLSQLKL
ncbi:hypothetical protein [Streptobacillus felis]|nr:hypothetical protein [Streptobacillus felis]